LELFSGSAYSVMLGFGGQYPGLARGIASRHRRAAQGEIIRFRAAGRKNDFIRAAAQYRSDLLPRRIHGGFGFLSQPMDGRWIPVILAEIRHHRIQNTRVDRRGGGIIKINHGRDYTFIIKAIMRKKSIININLRWFLAGMIFANIAGQMAYSMLSLYMLDLGASVVQVGMVFTLASLVPMVLQIFGGWLSDTIGRLRIMAIGSSIAVFGYLIFAFAPNWQWVLIGLSIEYVSNSVVGPSFGAYISEQSSEESRGRVFGITTSHLSNRHGHRTRAGRLPRLSIRLRN
jgi:hypothetical protein